MNLSPISVSAIQSSPTVALPPGRWPRSGGAGRRTRPVFGRFQRVLGPSGGCPLLTPAQPGRDGHPFAPAGTRSGRRCSGPPGPTTAISRVGAQRVAPLLYAVGRFKPFATVAIRVDQTVQDVSPILAWCADVVASWLSGCPFASPCGAVRFWRQTISSCALRSGHDPWSPHCGNA